MAGGMRSGRGLTLAERSELSGLVRDRPPDRAGRRHCWVAATTPDVGPWPGLVLDWQRTGDGWRAFVVYLADASTDGGGPEPRTDSTGEARGDCPRRTVAVQEWVQAARLTPAVGTSR